MPPAAAKPPSLSCFADPAAAPSESDLGRALGPAAGAWRSLVEHVERTCAPVVEQWGFAGARFGWSLRLRQADRVVVYLIPQASQFLVGIVLGPRALAAAQSAGLPAAVTRALAEAPRYAEGTGLRLPVVDASALPAVHTLIALKLARR